MNDSDSNDADLVDWLISQGVHVDGSYLDADSND